MRKAIRWLKTLCAFLVGITAVGIGLAKDDSAQDAATIIENDLRLVPDYAFGFAVVRSADMFRLASGVRELTHPLPFEPKDVERFVVAVSPSPFGIVASTAYELNHEVNRQEVINRFSPTAEVSPDDKNVFVAADAGPSVGFLDDHSFVTSADAGLVYHLVDQVRRLRRGKRQVEPKLIQRAASAECYFLGEIDRLLHFVEVYTGNLAVSKWQAVQNVDTIFASLDLHSPCQLAVVARDNTPAHLDVVRRSPLEILKSEALSFFFVPQVVGPKVDEIRKMVVQALDSARISRTNSEVRVEVALASADFALKIAHQLGELQLRKLKRFVANLQFRSNLQYLGLAIHNYHGVYRRLPTNIKDVSGNPILSWRVAILPYIGQEVLYEQFRLNEPWDSEHNQRLLNKMPSLFAGRTQALTHTPILRVVGPGTSGEAERWSDIFSLDHSLLLVEAEEPVAWTRPKDFLVSQVSPSKGLRAPTAFGVMCSGLAFEMQWRHSVNVLRSAFARGGTEFDIQLLEVSSDSAPESMSKVEALQLINSPQDADVLRGLRFLGSKDPLGPLPQAEEILERATKLVDSQTPLVRGHALKLIRNLRVYGQVNPRSIEPVLQDSYDANRWLAAEILGEYPEPELVAKLLKLPAQDQHIVGTVIYDKCSDFAADAAVPLLKSDDRQIRMSACYLIGYTGAPRHVPALRQLTDDEDEACRQAAVFAIETLKKEAR